MTKYVQHELKVESNKEELARQNFVMGMRSYVLHDMANGMRAAYDAKIEPAFERRQGRKPLDGPEVHKALKNETSFKFYSNMRCNTQEMSFRSVLPAIERNVENLNRKAKTLSQSTEKAAGSVDINSTFEIPKSVANIDVHLMPGSYVTEYAEDDVTQGAVYDNGISVFSMGFFGENLDDIGSTLALYISKKYPDFSPSKILDLGCTIGHNTVPWARTYPEAEVHAIDVAAPALRYGHARAQSQGATVHFHQQSAEATEFEDESFDMIFSSMFLHEVPKDGIHKAFREAHRLLKPGGLMLHMELPPNKMLGAYDAFYMDWDSYYNKEPYYKTFRDMDPVKVCVAAGFKETNFIQYIVPSLGLYGRNAVLDSVKEALTEANENTGRFGDGIMWYSFGAWK